jgi:hypothetical protein
MPEWLTNWTLLPMSDMTLRGPPGMYTNGTLRVRLR